MRRSNLVCIGKWPSAMACHGMGPCRAQAETNRFPPFDVFVFSASAFFKQKNCLEMMSFLPFLWGLAMPTSPPVAPGHGVGDQSFLVVEKQLGSYNLPPEFVCEGLKFQMMWLLEIFASLLYLLLLSLSHRQSKASITSGKICVKMSPTNCRAQGIDYIPEHERISQNKKKTTISKRKWSIFHPTQPLMFSKICCFWKKNQELRWRSQKRIPPEQRVRGSQAALVERCWKFGSKGQLKWGPKK